jgi:hypothetical protein
MKVLTRQYSLLSLSDVTTLIRVGSLSALAGIAPSREPSGLLVCAIGRSSVRSLPRLSRVAVTCVDAGDGGAPGRHLRAHASSMVSLIRFGRFEPRTHFWSAASNDRRLPVEPSCRRRQGFVGTDGPAVFLVAYFVAAFGFAPFEAAGFLLSR